MATGGAFARETDAAVLLISTEQETALPWLAAVNCSTLGGEC